MAKLSSEERALFPLSDIDSVVKLFRIHLSKNSEPNLAILSIIIGYIENTLTCSRGGSEPTPELDDDCSGKRAEDHRVLPVVDYETVEALHQRFLAIIKAHVDVTAFGSPRYGTRELIKRISDVVWCTLSSSYYKDRAHLQSIYSYMTGEWCKGRDPIEKIRMLKLLDKYILVNFHVVSYGPTTYTFSVNSCAFMWTFGMKMVWPYNTSENQCSHCLQIWCQCSKASW